MHLKVLLVNGDRESSAVLRQTLQDNGHEVVAQCSAPGDLAATALRGQQDILVISSNYPEEAIFTQLRELAHNAPQPVVLFTAGDSRHMASKAIESGVSAFVVDGVQTQRVGTVIEVAVARFQETQRLRRELNETRESLLERKKVERAKGIIMKQRGYDEPQAYHALRKMAMDKNLRIGQVADNVIAVAELLN